MTTGEEASRIAKVEAELAAHSAKFEERERAEGQAERERALAAAAVQTALQDAASASSTALAAAAKAQAEALTAALKAADTLEQERVRRAEADTESVENKLFDKITEVKDAASLALVASKEILDRHNELLRTMSEKDGTYATIESVRLMKEGFDTRHVDDLKRVNDDIQQLRAEQATATGTDAGKLDARTLLISLLVFVVGIAAVVSPHIH
jgi:hypothetical protein